jgi:APA family basic amino acid/polyamine antiporter
LVPLLDGHENVIAALVIASMTALNSLGLRQGSAVQQTVSLLKVAMLLALVGSAFAFADAPLSASATSAPKLSPVGAIAIVLALQMAIEAYAGWNSACYFSEETKEPGRTLPRAFFGGIALIMAVYLAVNAALLHMLPLASLAASKLPAADAMTLLLGPAGKRIVTVLAIVSVLGICNATLMFTPRVLYGMARDKLFFARATQVTAGGTPLVALLIVAALAMLFASGSSFETLFAIAAFLSVCMMLMSDASLFILRWREPDLPRPYRAIGYPWLPGLLVAVEGALVAAYLLANPRPSVVGLTLIAITWPLFRLLRRPRTARIPTVEVEPTDESS